MIRMWKFLMGQEDIMESTRVLTIDGALFKRGPCRAKNSVLEAQGALQDISRRCTVIPRGVQCGGPVSLLKYHPPRESQHF